MSSPSNVYLDPRVSSRSSIEVSRTNSPLFARERSVKT